MLIGPYTYLSLLGLVTITGERKRLNNSATLGFIATLK